jgi:FtsH-binding integral membrane protein
MGLSAVTAFAVVVSPAVTVLLIFNCEIFWALVLIELVLVFVFSVKVDSMVLDAG